MVDSIRVVVERCTACNEYASKLKREPLIIFAISMKQMCLPPEMGNLVPWLALGTLFGLLAYSLHAVQCSTTTLMLSTIPDEYHSRCKLHLLWTNGKLVDMHQKVFT